MLGQIVEALKSRNNLAGWTVRHLQSHEAQVYAVPQGLESHRTVDEHRYLIDVLRVNKTTDGNRAVGSGDASLLPGEDIDHAIEQATLVAGLVANPVHELPNPTSFPVVPLSDEDLKEDPSKVMNAVMERLRDTTGKQPDVRLTAVECIGQARTTHLINSQGVDVDQESTTIDIEFVLHGQKGERESEIFDELSRRRVLDLELEGTFEDRIQFTWDALDAEPPPSWQGPIVVRGKALAKFLAGDNLIGSVIQTLASAGSRYAGIGPWEVGKSVFSGEVNGDPLNIWANRALPFGSASNRFDAEGLPAQCVQLIRNNEFVAFSASKRYADYLKIPATGAFGNIELAPGQTPAIALLAEPYAEVVQFSWFNPDRITGDFATEIRFGYLVRNGLRMPFRGGQMVGNYMDALANVNWSVETGFFSNYQGPHTTRFNKMKIAG